MTNRSNAVMTEALRLTRAGRLAEATGLLQRGLAGASTAPSAAVPTGNAAPKQQGADVHAQVIDAYHEPCKAKLPKLITPDRSSGGAPSSCFRAPATAARAAAGHTRHHAHTEAAGTRTYDLYVPSGYTGSVRGSFTIVCTLPEEHGICHYRIRSLTDGHERVVTESEVR